MGRLFAYRPALRPAPAVTLSALGGTTHAPSDGRGRSGAPDVRARWCPPCVVEMLGFVDPADERIACLRCLISNP